MGRPKGSKNKPKVNDSENNTIDNESQGIPHEQKEVIRKPDKLPKAVCACDLCGADIYSSPYVIRLQELTSRAYWHRECKHDILVLCGECSAGLNQMIDKYLLEKNPDLAKNRC